MIKVSSAPAIDNTSNTAITEVYPLRRSPKHTNLAGLWKPKLVLDTLAEGVEMEATNVKGQSVKR